MDIDEAQEIVEQEAFEQEEKKSAVLSRSRTRSRSRSRLCNFSPPSTDIFMLMSKNLILFYLRSTFSSGINKMNILQVPKEKKVQVTIWLSKA